jgi:serine protein kinase
MSSNQKPTLEELLNLKPLTGAPIKLLQFLRELKNHPERAETAAALLVRAVKSRGEVSEKEIDDLERNAPTQNAVKRARYLRMLKTRGVPLYKAFMHVRGSQRAVARIMKFLEAAATNGYQLRQLMALIGPPGCGKSFLIEALKRLLEGQEVYAVEGCPVHENPVNLLKLLPAETIEQISNELELGTLLTDLLRVAGEPCEHCWSKVMAGGDGKTPSLNINVVPIRLSSRKGGIATWLPTGSHDSCSLLDALKQGSRGVTDLPEAFSETRELIVLLGATEDRRIPSCADHADGEPEAESKPDAKPEAKPEASPKANRKARGRSSKVAGFMPCDTLIVLQSNEGAWKAFIKEQKDPKRFTRRSFILTVPYNTSICEEVETYQDFISILKARPHIDPLALELAAMLAVASRMKKDSDTGVTLEHRMRLYNGESLVILRTSSLSSRAKESDRWSGGSASSPDSTDSKNVQVTDIWDAAGEKEATEGLSVPLMLSAISQTCEMAMSSKGNKPRCITALAMLSYLRGRIETELGTPELQDSDRKVLENCREFLKEIKYKSDTPGLIEREYRRLLRGQIISAFAPDYEERAALDFDVYRTHAKAAAKGDTKVFDKRYGKEIEIDNEFLEAIERLMDKTTSNERTEFRQALETELSDKIKQQIKEFGPDAQVSPSWRTLPELRKAIAKKLDEQIAKDVERCLLDEMNLNSDEDRKLRRDSLERFEKFGYCQHCAKTALTYIKEFKLWSTQS